jgi:hypothetical protein
MKLHLLRAAGASLVLLLLLTSCAFSGFVRVPRRVPFDESAFAGYGGPGSGSVVGQLIVTWQGHTYPGEGNSITLIPVTAYTREMVERELGDGVYLTPSDPRFKKYVRITNADHQGNFAFHQIPAGEYFVAGEVSWNGSGSSDSLYYQWGCERVKVGTGQTVRIKVSHNPQHGNSPIQVIWTLE